MQTVRMVALSMMLALVSGCETVNSVGKGVKGAFSGAESADNVKLIIDGVKVEPVPVAPRASLKKSGDWFEVELDDFDRVEAKQQTRVWCWAACAQMVHQWNGGSMDQREIALRVKGEAEDGDATEGGAADPKVEAAGMYEIMIALAPELGMSPDSATKRALQRIAAADDVSQLEMSFDPEELVKARAEIAMLRYNDNQMNKAAWINTAVEELSDAQPLVAGLRDENDPNFGHAVIVRGVTYVPRSPNVLKQYQKEHAEDVPGADRVIANYKVSSITIYDPWEGKSAAMDEAAFARRVDFVLGKSDAMRILSRQWETVKVTSE